MPLNVRRFYSSILLVLVFVGIVSISHAQTTVPSSTVQAPTSGDVMRERISKAKAYIVVRNYNAAIYELENIRKETSDASVQAVVNVLLMNSYLEQGDYKRSQDLLNEFYAQQKTTKANAAANYMAVASQVVKGARSRAERYRALGLSVADRTLPLEALNDIEKMRETLELVVTQSKEIGQTPAKTADAMALLEEASASRSILARDDYDSRRWKDEVADTREQMTNSRSVVLSAVNGEPAVTPKNDTLAVNKPADIPAGSQPVMRGVADPGTATRDREVKTEPVYIPAPPPVKEEPKKEEPKQETPKQEEPKPVVTVPSAAPANNANVSPVDVGSLVPYVTKQTPPSYPAAAKAMRATGVVRVDLTINETGDVAEVQKTSGPMMLQAAAKDAIKKWKFKPFLKDGQPVRAIGYINFNFSL